MISWILGLDAVIVLCLAWTPHVNATCPFGDYSKDDCGVDSYKAFGGTSCPCQPGLCCSKAGKCGPANSSLADQTLFCGAGCQSRYGACIFVRKNLSKHLLVCLPISRFLNMTSAQPRRDVSCNCLMQHTSPHSLVEIKLQLQLHLPFIICRWLRHYPP